MWTRLRLKVKHICIMLQLISWPWCWQLWYFGSSSYKLRLQEIMKQFIVWIIYSINAEAWMIAIEPSNCHIQLCASKILCMTLYFWLIDDQMKFPAQSITIFEPFTKTLIIWTYTDNIHIYAPSRSINWMALYCLVNLAQSNFKLKLIWAVRLICTGSTTEMGVICKTTRILGRISKFPNQHQ